MRVAFLLLLALSASVLAAPIPKDRKKNDDKQLLVGKWTSIKFNGNANQGSALQLEFDENGTVWTLNPNGGRASEWQWALVEDQSPKQMRWNSKQGNNWDCVYDLNDDVLLLGFIGRGQPVPTKVEVQPNLTLYEMKRK
jgi:uncharacterized protein (TIGR03067 family)